MNNTLSAEDRAFQEQVRQFIADEYPDDIRARMDGQIELDREDFIRWQKILYNKGWAAVNWPVEYGGTGWTPVQKYLFANECARANTPRIVPFGLSMVGPVIYTYGNDAQKQRFLPDILASNVWWCQGYSEPNAGSDLASLKTTAVREGDHYIVNGSKTWNTYGQYADWIFCLVRTGSTDSKAQEGISFLLIDMRTAGITLSPIVLLDGTPEVNEVFFDNVRVPAENLIGVENEGWTYAKFLLSHERTGIAQVARSKTRLQNLKRRAGAVDNGGTPLLHDPFFSKKVHELETDLIALEFTELRVLASLAAGSAPGPASSILKIKGTEIAQAIDEMFMELAGYHAMAFVPDQFRDGFSGEAIGEGTAANSARVFLNNRKASIYGGSNEIQRNIISKQVLRL